jgi:cell wall-associated NlpC family hydrolase
VSIYQSASNGSDTTILSVDPSELASSQKYTQAASDRDNTLVDELNVSKAELSVREREAQTARLRAQQDVAALQTAQAALHAQEAQLQALNGQVQGQLVSLVARAQAQASPAPGDVGPIPAVGGGAGQAVAYARAQLGRCYATGGTGNPCFDCSGLTMMAWGSAGVGMSHFSGAQYDEFPHVPMSALQPGDLVFTADPGQHVGIYIGGGTAIHASNPANNPNAVREIGVGYFSLAARP